MSHSRDPTRIARELFDGLPDRYDRLVERLSLGQNGRWRTAMVDHITPTDPGCSLDVASGTAGVAIQVARRTNARVVGVDLTEEMVRRGQRNVVSAGVGHQVSLTIGKAEQLSFPDDTFDALTFTYLLRYVEDPQETLQELARVLRPGGAMASLEFFVPPNRFWRLWWWGFTRFVLPAAGWVTGGREWFGVGRFLGPSISGHYRRYPLPWHTAAWENAGFVDVGVRIMSLGGGLIMWGTKARD